MHFEEILSIFLCFLFTGKKIGEMIQSVAFKIYFSYSPNNSSFVYIFLLITKPQYIIVKDQYLLKSTNVLTDTLLIPSITKLQSVFAANILSCGRQYNNLAINTRSTYEMNS